MTLYSLPLSLSSLSPSSLYSLPPFPTLSLSQQETDNIQQPVNGQAAFNPEDLAGTYPYQWERMAAQQANNMAIGTQDVS